VRVDLGDASSGRFSGDLLISFHGSSQTVPMTVTVKDDWGWPLLVIVTGVGLGVVVSAYRTQGRPRDKVLVRAGQLRAQMRGDAELAQPFRARIEAHLADVEAALQGEKWQDSEQAVGRAEAVWLRWRRGHADWLEQLAYQAELAGRLEDEPDVAYTQAVRRGLKDALRGAADLAGPDALREQLSGLAQQINRYLRLQDRMDELNHLRNRVSGDAAETWRLKAQGLQRRSGDLKPDDEATYQTLQSEVEAAILELDRLVEEQPDPAIAFEKGARGLGASVRQLLAPAPSARQLTLEEEVTVARARLRAFTWVSCGLAVALLAGAGFGELYVANASFGANAWGDYFALLAWGFGAEATRAAVAQMVRGWGLAGIE
jgi:hypothetical protein